MATPDFLEWLMREEEEFGLTGAIERTIDPEACRRMLQEELHYKFPKEVSEAQVKAMYETARYKYETLPEIAARPELYVRPWGKQVTYRDIPTGRFIGREEVEWRRVQAGF